MFDYSPLWKTLEEKGISQYHLIKCGIDNKTLDSLKKNKNVTVQTIDRLCNIINCTPNDIIRITFTDSNVNVLLKTAKG